MSTIAPVKQWGAICPIRGSLFPTLQLHWTLLVCITYIDFPCNHSEVVLRQYCIIINHSRQQRCVGRQGSAGLSSAWRCSLRVSSFSWDRQASLGPVFSWRCQGASSTTKPLFGIMLMACLLTFGWPKQVTMVNPNKRHGEHTPFHWGSYEIPWQSVRLQRWITEDINTIWQKQELTFLKRQARINRKSKHIP